MRHYGIPNKYISIIKATYEGMTCRVLHGGDATEKFQVLTGVRQGCILSLFLFLMVIDWVMKKTTQGKENGIQWTIRDQLDDLDLLMTLPFFNISTVRYRTKHQLLNG